MEQNTRKQDSAKTIANVLEVGAILWLLFIVQGLGSSETWRIDKPPNLYGFIFPPPEECSLRDAFENVLLGIPGGILLGIRGSILRRHLLPILGMILFVVGGVGLLMEILQWWIPGRTPSLIDALAIAFGGVLGGATGWLLGRNIRGFLLEVTRSGALIRYLLVSLWILSAVVPGRLMLSRDMFQQSLRLLSDHSPLSLQLLLLHFTSWLLAALLLRGASGRERVLLVMAFSFRIFLLAITPGRVVEREAVIAGVSAIILWSVPFLQKYIGVTFISFLSVITALVFSLPPGIKAGSGFFSLDPGFTLIVPGKLDSFRRILQDNFYILALPFLWAMSGKFSRRTFVLVLFCGLVFLTRIQILRASILSAQGSTGIVFLFLVSGIIAFVFYDRWTLQQDSFRMSASSK